MSPLSRRFGPLAVVIAGLVLTAAGRADPPEVDYARAVTRLEQLVEAELERHILTGVSLALVDDQRTVFAEGFGWADEAERRPATRRTIYRAGSISKLFTALAAMQLVEQGKLDLDEPVSRFWPGFRIVVPFDDAGPITLRQLICHRSGLVRESPVGGYFDPAEPSISETVASLADCVLVHRPNTVTKYSNIGVTVVGHVVAEVSGEPFNCYQREHLLRAIGMTSSAFLADETIRRRLATGYMQVADGRGGFRRTESPRFELGTIPAGNLYTSAEDLGRFLAFLFARGEVDGKPIVKPATLDTMFTPQLVEGDSGYGLGFHVTRFRDRKRISHMGAVYGFTSSVAAIPELKVGVVVLANEDIATGPVRKLADAALGWMVEAKLGAEPSQQEPEKEPADAAPLDPEPFTGNYESASYWARIEPADGHLGLVQKQLSVLGEGRSHFRVAKIGTVHNLLSDNSLVANISGQRLILTPAGRNQFTADGRWTTDAPVEFRRDDGGRVTEFEAMGQTFYRVDPDAVPEVPGAWQQLRGSYGPEFIPLVVSVKHGHLYAMTENLVDYRLTPLCRTVFKMPPGMYVDEQLVFQPGPDGRVHSAVLAGMVLRRAGP